MRLFRMSSHTIENTRDFSTCFSPCDLLLSRNEAAVFILNKYRLFTPETRFFAELFFLVTVTPRKASDAVPERLEGMECMKYALRGSDRDFIKRHFAEEDFLRDARFIYELTKKAPLEEPHRRAAFCLLLAGYRLAAVRPDEEGFTITPEEIADAYNGIRRAPAAEKLAVTDGDTVFVTPGRAPTEILIDTKAARKALEEDRGLRISVKRLVLVPSKDPLSPQRAELNVINAEDGSRDTLELTAKDSIFINFAGNIPVYVHPKISRGRDCTVTRLETAVIYSDVNGDKRYEAPDIICAAAQTGGKGFMMLRGSGLDSSGYSGRASFIFDGEAAVEIYTCPEGVIWLCDDGTVHSDFRTFNCGGRYAAIGDFLKDTDEVKEYGNGN